LLDASHIQAKQAELTGRKTTDGATVTGGATGTTNEFGSVRKETYLTFGLFYLVANLRRIERRDQFRK
jgi:hypothetical protein